MVSLQKFYDFVEEITKSNSRQYKQDILRKYKQDNDIKKYLWFIYNPFVKTGIARKKLNKTVSCNGLVFTSTFMLFDYIRVNSTGNDFDIKTCQNYLASLPEHLKGLFASIITKDLPIGIDAKTINSVIPDLIPQFNVQLANKYFDNPKVVEGKEFAITTKIDGGRIIAIKNNNRVSFYTRAGQLYEGLVDLEKEMLEKFPDNICLDGEITLLDKGNLTSKEQYKETMKITRKDGEKHGVKMLVFDCMSALDFEYQYCNESYKTRRTLLDDLPFADLTYFELLPVLYQGRDTSKIAELLKENVSKGEEGIMVNLVEGEYQFKRTNNLLKVKLMQDIDLRVVDLEEGDGRNAGRLGALLCKYKNNIVKVGSGFTDALRDEIWQHKEKYLNKIVSIQYFEETSNADGGESLRFPIFLDFREDKLEPDA